MSVCFRKVGPAMMAIAVIVLAMSGPAFAVTLGTGLIADWSLDEGTGMVGDDSVGIHDVQLLASPGTPAWITGHIGAGALSFDGVDDGAAIYSSETLNPGTNAMTISTWVKLDTLPSDLSSSWAGIIDASDDNYVLYLDRGSSELRLKLVDSNGTNDRPGIPQTMLDTTSWHHVVAVYDGSMAWAKLYCDGVLADVHGQNGWVDNVREGQTAGLGFQPVDPDDKESVAMNFFPGSIDETAIWNRALSGTEVTYLYNNGAGLDVSDNASVIVATNPLAGPVIRYEFENNISNSGTGGSTYDGTMHDGADGTHSYTSIGTGDNAIQFTCPTKNEAGYKTDGDYVQVDYTMPNEGTIAFWCKPDDDFDWLAVMDNSVNDGDWEMWIYKDGRARFRIEGNTQVTYDIDGSLVGGPGNWFHCAVAWERTGNNVALSMFINGELVDADEGVWADPGDYFYLPTGQTNNDCGDISLDDFRIYEEALTAAEINDVMNKVPEPGAFMLLISALALLGLRRK